MLRTLSVRNYVLIDSLDISFPEGLIIITGQTGAGKSIILGALSLLMGAKADAGVIGEGADGCVVEGCFEVAGDDEAVRGILDDNDVEWDEGRLLVRRVVARSGRSRSFVNDCPVPVGVLSELSARLIDVHSQHQSLLLTDRRYQLSVLDSYAGNSGLLAACRACWESVQGLKAERAKVAERLAGLSAERSYNEARYAQLEAARLRDGELEELEAEQQQLANAEQIKESLTSAEELLSPSAGESSVASLLKEASRMLEKAGRFVPDAAVLASRLDSTRIEIEDVLSEVSSTNSGIDLSAERLEAVEARMALIYDLFVKYSCRTVAELIETRDRYSEALFDSSSLEERIAELDAQMALAQKSLSEAAAALHARRVEAARGFAAEILSSVRFLELDMAVFDVAVEDAPLSATGSDAVTFLFSSTGKAPVDIAKCASGGEISRIMLSLKALMARFTHMPTMIFDEIDSGVSGSVADRMGSMICGMGADMQVFAITHLPQVAAKGTAHYLVTKEYDQASDRTISRIRPLDEEQRVLEVARMLSGATVSEEAIANARSLLSR